MNISHLPGISMVREFNFLIFKNKPKLWFYMTNDIFGSTIYDLSPFRLKRKGAEF